MEEPQTPQTSPPNQPPEQPPAAVTLPDPPPAPAPPPEAVPPASPEAAPEQPLMPEPASNTPAASEDATAAPATTSGTKRVLMVEDDDSLANVYTMRLEAEGFEVRRVPNGEDALAAALDYKPDLILLDVMMPKVSGFDVLDILRNTPQTAQVKIVMLTALSQEADQQRAKELGVNDYLVKSQVVIADVVDRIKFHLGM